ncbi:hypothetical protein [Aquimarina hainanensis]
MILDLFMGICIEDVLTISRISRFFGGVLRKLYGRFNPICDSGMFF